MNPWWRSELWRLLAIGGASAAAGAALGEPLIGLLVGLGSYLVWHLYHVAALANWLGNDPDAELPDGQGMWADVFRRLHGVRKEYHAEIERLEGLLERYRQTTKALPEAAVALGAHGEIELVNEAAQTLLGVQDPQDLGSRITNIVRVPEFVDFIQKNRVDRALEMVSPQDSQTMLSIRIVPYTGVDKRLLLARDISRLHKLEQIRRDFIANVSHEMKSPLTVIKGYVESISDDESEFAEKWRKPLTQIDQQTERLCRIVEDLLQLSGLETSPISDDPSPVDVFALTHSIVAEARELSVGHHDFDTDIEPRLHLLGNFNELYSAFSNLVFNAVRYTEAGGKIKISWSVAPDGAAHFRVADTGIGIAAEHIPRLTERFYRIDQARSRELGGTGLGLAIVKHVLIRHGATLKVESERGKGSVFTCRFPAERVVSKPRTARSA